MLVAMFNKLVSLRWLYVNVCGMEMRWRWEQACILHCGKELKSVDETEFRNRAYCMCLGSSSLI